MKVPAPLLQGQLDSLCGVYALINAVRLLLGNPTRSSADVLFNRLLDEIDADHGINHTIHEGIAFDTELKLAKAVVSTIGSQHKTHLAVRPLIDARRRPRLPIVTAQVAQVIDTGGVVIAAFMGRLNHWSVIRQVTPLHLGLYDSSGLMRVRVDRCRMTYEPSRTTGDHVIDLKGLFALTPLTMSPDERTSRQDVPQG